MGNQNRKSTKAEKAYAAKVLRDAFPGMTAIFGAHGDYGGHRAPRDHTIAFRLQDSDGRFCSNVVWIMPERLSTLTVADARTMVDRANGRR
jgi:hypothetical protein